MEDVFYFNSLFDCVQWLSKKSPTAWVYITRRTTDYKAEIVKALPIAQENSVYSNFVSMAISWGHPNHRKAEAIPSANLIAVWAGENKYSLSNG